jgi:hypothetical protein
VQARAPTQHCATLISIWHPRCAAGCAARQWRLATHRSATRAGGELITRDFFNASIAGRHNPHIAADLFPEESVEQHLAFSDNKEAYFRSLAKGSAFQSLVSCRPLG